MISMAICSAEMSAIAAVYIFILKALKNRQLPKWRYYSWIVILLGFLFPFKPSFGSPAITIESPNMSAAPTQPIYSDVAPTASHISIHMILFFVWLTGALLYIAVMMYRSITFSKSVKRLSIVADSESTELAQRVAKDMGITIPVKLAVMKEIASPMMTGMLSPVILLPTRDFSREELRLVLKHELTHFKHKDLLFKAFIMLCRAVHWFNPFMIFISRFIEQECEFYCDHDVVRNESEDARKLYCQSILATVSAQHNMNKKSMARPVIATNFYTPKQGLKHRLKLILSFRRKKRFIIVCAAAVILTAASGTFVAFASNTEVAESSVVSDTVTEAPAVSIVTTQPTEPTLSDEEKYVTTTTTAVSSISEPQLPDAENKATSTMRLRETTNPDENLNIKVSTTTTVKNADRVVTDTAPVTSTVTATISE